MCIIGRKYIVSQSLKKIKKDDDSFVFTDKSWKFVDNDETVSFVDFKNLAINKFAQGDELTDEELRTLNRDCIYKVIPTKHKVPKVQFINMKLQQNIEFNDGLFVIFSAKYYLYEKGILNSQIDRANKMLSNDTSRLSTNPNNPKRFIKTICVNVQAEVVNCDEVNIIAQKLIDHKEQTLGLYRTATNIEDANIHYILGVNKRRRQIELNFRILKSEFKARPVYVRTPESIKTHFATCYTALLLLKNWSEK